MKKAIKETLHYSVILALAALTTWTHWAVSVGVLIGAMCYIVTEAKRATTSTTDPGKP